MGTALALAGRKRLIEVAVAKDRCQNPSEIPMRFPQHQPELRTLPVRRQPRRQGSDWLHFTQHHAKHRCATPVLDSLRGCTVQTRARGAKCLNGNRAVSGTAKPCPFHRWRDAPAWKCKVRQTWPHTDVQRRVGAQSWRRSEDDRFWQSGLRLPLTATPYDAPRRYGPGGDEKTTPWPGQEGSCNTRDARLG